MKILTISEIAAAVGGSTSLDGEIKSICTDTRDMQEGCLFICIEGENFDGHKFAQKALESGAAAVLCHKDTGCRGQIMTSDTRKALLDLAKYYRGLFPITVCGITGSVGKTTTKEMTCDVLGKKYNTLKTEGNLNNEIGLPKTLFRLDESYEAAVIEMGMSALGEISRLSQTAMPTMGIIGNIGVSHLEKLGTRGNILKAKMEIIDGMKADAPLILNGDDEYLVTVNAGSRPVYYYGINKKRCEIMASDIQSDGMNTEFTVGFGEIKQRVRLPAIGIHNVYNALAAFTAGTIAGVDSQAAADALGQYVPSGMRQRIHEMGNIKIIEDCYNASPDSMKAAISTLAQIKAKRRIAVLGDMLELGSVSAEGHRKTGVLAAQNGIDAVFTYGTQSLETAKAASEYGVMTVESFDDKKKLADTLNAFLEDGDAVLFKASRGMKLEEIIQQLIIK